MLKDGSKINTFFKNIQIHNFCLISRHTWFLNLKGDYSRKSPLVWKAREEILGHGTKSEELRLKKKKELVENPTDFDTWKCVGLATKFQWRRNTFPCVNSMKMFKWIRFTYPSSTSRYWVRTFSELNQAWSRKDCITSRKLENVNVSLEKPKLEGRKKGVYRCCHISGQKKKKKFIRIEIPRHLTY